MRRFAACIFTLLLTQVVGLSSAMAAWHSCHFGVPSYGSPSYSYETYYHRTYFDQYDYDFVAMAFGSPPITPFVRVQHDVGSTTYAERIEQMLAYGSLPKTLDWYVPDLPNGSYSSSAEFDLGQYNASGFLGVTGYADCNKSGVVANVPSISISLPTTLTLNSNYSFSVSVSPSFHAPSVTNYKLEMKRNSLSTWYTVHNGSSPNFSSYAKVAGAFKVRASVTINGVTYISSEVDHTVNFPTASQIMANSTVASATAAAWTSIKNYAVANQTKRREEGFWIGFNTATRQAVIYSTVYGTPVSNGSSSTPPAGATLGIGSRPVDSIGSPTPLDSPTYVLAVFHGHTPFTYVHSNWDRDTGASPADISHANSNDVVGLVYDYNASYIVGGHNINASASLKAYGPTKRSTP